ncbi:MAG: rod shape-determining protein RodA, partial [Deltaproteobacteria bacterium]|nr:rod shape-determining protein RodA [Deltaproteobacteria bacterium]
MFDRRLVQHFDWGLFGLTLLLGILGVITLYSAVTAGSQNPQKVIYIKQIIWFVSGLVLMTAVFLFDYKKLDQWALLIYAACILLLICVLVFGPYIGGSRRWLILGWISIQPSELVKIALIIVLSRYYSRHVNTTGLTIKDLVIPVVLTLIPFILIVKQPDLGTALLLAMIAGTITLFVKIERRSLLFILSTCAVTVPLIWRFLRGYQKQRILTFLNPDRDPLGAGYHIIQSKIAIGSGMITGKGYLKGTQNTLSFLPEQHTDFIFSVLAEEWGFVGSTILILILLILIIWGL